MGDIGPGDELSLPSIRPRVNIKIREYFKQSPEVPEQEWLSRPELPSSNEVLDLDLTTSGSIVELECNKKKGAWESKDQYLSTLYNLLREEGVAAIREAVAQLRSFPKSYEDTFMKSKVKIGIYDKVHICGITPSSRGVATKVTFSLVRVGKIIVWEQSKRLLPGTLVILTPQSDMFQRVAIVATVAARPLTALQSNPPEIDLFFARSEELEIDPAVEYVMIEARDTLFEAQRHTLCALQRMMQEETPFSEHLIDVNPTVGAPLYVQAAPDMDLTTIFQDKNQDAQESRKTQDSDFRRPEPHCRTHVLDNWPKDAATSLDLSQLTALHRIIARKLAIIQGPPGTGKTYISVQAVKVMLANRKTGDPPIIIACQTNHAIDQILRHISDFESDFVRLGGMSKDRQIVRQRTLYEIQRAEVREKPVGSLFGSAMKSLRAMQRTIQVVLEDLKPSEKPMDHRKLEELGIITKDQADSLEAGAQKWVSGNQDETGEPSSPFTLWLGDQLLAVPHKQQEEEYGFKDEEADNGFERIKEIEADAFEKDAGEIDKLNGPFIAIADNFTCRKVPGRKFDFQTARQEQDLWNIPLARRGAFYRCLQTELKKRICGDVRKKAKEFEKFVEQRRIGRFEDQECILREQKIIGMTTTGLSKNRAMISALEPKIVLIEEAAEILEPPVTVACLPSVQHLILVGDHKQLQPHTYIDQSFGLNISLFERMLKNDVEFSMLTKQRRMIPEIRRLLYPIYGNIIEDHECVSDRSDVVGLNEVNSYFFTHRWTERKDELMSVYNPMEAEMIAHFFEYLCFNNVKPSDITVLTFYHGQRKQIVTELRKSEFLLGISGESKFNVVTVDSYQGEENKIVILSLARSNSRGEIGFLNVPNRICVALSRARDGFYIFGNATTLRESGSREWRSVLDIMEGKEKRVEPQVVTRRLSTELPLRCVNHRISFVARDPDDFAKRSGGCSKPCRGVLRCGCICDKTCHSFDHALLACSSCDRVDGALDQLVVPRRHATELEVRDLVEESGNAWMPQSDVAFQGPRPSSDRPQLALPEIPIKWADYVGRAASEHTESTVVDLSSEPGLDLFPFGDESPVLTQDTANEASLLDKVWPSITPASRSNLKNDMLGDVVADEGVNAVEIEPQGVSLLD